MDRAQLSRPGCEAPPHEWGFTLAQTRGRRDFLLNPAQHRLAIGARLVRLANNA